MEGYPERYGKTYPCEKGALVVYYPCGAAAVKCIYQMRFAA